MAKYRLEQVIVLSRHGIRSSLPTTTGFLSTVTPKAWPKWDSPPGYLTTRGGVLEAYFGHYLAQWLIASGLDSTQADIFVYANSLHRTVATAQFLTLGAFSGLDIAINHRYPIEKMDPIFDPVIRNSDPCFKRVVLDDIRQYTHSQHDIDRLNEQLTPAYQLLADKLNYRQSRLYQRYQCDLQHIPTTLDIQLNQEPILLGPLAIATAVADAFTLQYYSAFQQHDVAWGEIVDDREWQMITDFKNQYINILFKSPLLARHFSVPLVKLIRDIFSKQQHKVNILVGHDSNIAALLGALKFQDYQLPGQYELTPIGGKVILQRWRDVKNQQSYFKAEYIYQTFEQIRLGLPLDQHNLPQRMTLLFSDLSQKGDGYYLWHDIERKLIDCSL